MYRTSPRSFTHSLRSSPFVHLSLLQTLNRIKRGPGGSLFACLFLSPSQAFCIRASFPSILFFGVGSFFSLSDFEHFLKLKRVVQKQPASQPAKRQSRGRNTQVKKEKKKESVGAQLSVQHVLSQLSTPHRQRAPAQPRRLPLRQRAQEPRGGEARSRIGREGRSVEGENVGHHRDEPGQAV